MNLLDLGHRRTANARAAKLAKMPAQPHDPAPQSDAGRVLTAIRAAKTGLPNWAIARNVKLSAVTVKYACKYLRKRGLAFPHRTEYPDRATGVECVQACWFPTAAVRRVTMIDTTFCRMSLGYGRSCDTRLVERVDAIGRITWQCPACARRNAGICRTCPRPTVRTAVDGPAPWYCPTCLKERRRKRNAARALTPEHKAWKAAYERQRVAKCKAEGRPYRYDRLKQEAA